MLSLISTVVGALIRYLPNLFGFVGDWLGKKQEQKQEEAAVLLQIKLEEAKNAGSAKVAEISAESAQALADIQAGLAELQSAVADRQSARSYGSTLHTSLVNVLQSGKDLGIPKWVLSFGWMIVLLVEAFAAGVQPGIAAAGFTMWGAWKISLFTLARSQTGSTVAAVISVWTAEDWVLIDGIMGFFLAGRAIKYSDAKATKCAG